jgi:predicted nucleic acid-binding protein
MKIIVDTNVIFSVLINSDGNIGDIIFNSDKHFEFYSCKYMQIEIKNHWEKLKKISKLSENELQISYNQVLSKIKFINEELIPMETWLASEEITKDIDVDDIDFVALTKFLKGTLWTGDKALYNGLKRLNFKKLASTADILELRATKRKYK